MNRGMTMRTAIATAALILLMSLTACRTDFRAEAAESARAFALKHAKDLSETDRNFIRYNDPVIYSNLLFRSSIPSFESIGGGPNRYDSYEAEADMSMDYMHTAFVWKLPKSGFSVVVDGAGERSHRGWSPNVVLFKKFIPEKTAYSAARIRATSFIANFFPDMKMTDLNQVRFSEPKVIATTFQLEPPDEKKEKEKQVKKWMDYIRSGDAPEKDPVQISLVWISPLNGEAIVACGTAPKENLFNWSPKRAYLLPPAELETMTVKDKIISLEDPEDDNGNKIETRDLREKATIDETGNKELKNRETRFDERE